jgi:hypothetical protein
LLKVQPSLLPFQLVDPVVVLLLLQAELPLVVPPLKKRKKRRRKRVCYTNGRVFME